jgi:hypothetical protein
VFQGPAALVLPAGTTRQEAVWPRSDNPHGYIGALKSLAPGGRCGTQSSVSGSFDVVSSKSSLGPRPRPPG